MARILVGRVALVEETSLLRAGFAMKEYLLAPRMLTVRDLRGTQVLGATRVGSGGTNNERMSPKSF